MRYTILLIFLIIVSCSTKNETPPGANDAVEKIQQDSLLFQRDTTVNFSGSQAPDTFTISLTGKSFQEGKCTFRIINVDGDILYEQIFDANMLIDFGFNGNTNESAAENHIRYRLETFFAPDKFRLPAIAPDRTFEPEHSNKETWDAIRADQTIIGFYYLLGKEDKRYVAFSRKLKKVVLYYNCC